MLKKIYLFTLRTIIALTGMLIVVPRRAVAELRVLKVTTTLSSYADIARQIGGDAVEVKYVASPRFNPHFIEPKPSDVLKVKNADLFVHSGLDLEAWRGALVDATGAPDIRPGGARELDLSLGIPLLQVPQGPISRAQGDIHLFGNPHYWITPRNGEIIARSIAAKLVSVDPARRVHYEQNRDRFLRQLEERSARWLAAVAPYRDSELVGYHNEWIYLMAFLGLKMEQFLEPKPGIPPTPGRIEFLTDYIRRRNIRAIVQATFYPSDAADSLAERSGARVLKLCQNVGETPAVPDYLSLLEFDISQIVAALASGR